MKILHGTGERLELRAAILPPPHSDLVLPILRHAYRRIRSSEPATQRDLREMLAGVGAILRDLGYAVARPAPVAKGAIDRALEVLYARHTDPSLRIEHLARAARLSEPHFRRLFTKQMGSSPHRLLTRLRLFHAKRLTEMRYIKSTAAAAESGFGSVSAMYKQMRHHRRSLTA